MRFRYLAVGAWNTFAGYFIFLLIYVSFGEHIGYLASSALAHIFSVTQSFITQRRFVFCSTNYWLTEYLRFHITHLGSLGLGLILLPIMVELIKLSPQLAQILVTIAIVLISYFAHQHFTFADAARDKQ